MSDQLPPQDPRHDETSRRLRDALSARGGGVEPGDGWGTIVERLDRGPSAWTWITQHPLVIGAAAAVVVLLAVLTVNLLEGDDQALDTVTPPTPEDKSTLIAVDTEGRLVELDLDGHELREVASLTDYSSTKPFHLQGSIAVADEGAFFLGFTGSTVSCTDTDEVFVNDLWRYPLDLEPGVTLDLGQFDQASGLFAVSPDEQRIAYVDLPAEDPCSEPAVVVEDLASREEIARYPIVGGLSVSDVSWLTNAELGVTVVDGDGAAGLWTLEPGSGETSMTIPGTDPDLVVDVPRDLLVTPAANGKQFLVTSTSGNPFAEGDDVDGVVQVWRGSVGSPALDLVGQIDSYVWSGIDPAENPGADVAAVPLQALSVTSAPDGSVYLTVAATEHVDAGNLGVTVDDAGQVALFRIANDAEGGVTPVADGILAVDLKPGEEPAPAPADQAGPVIGARADGSLARLDPATGEVADEILADDEFPAAGQVGDGQGGDGAAHLGELAVSPDGSMLYQTRPSPTTSDCAGEGEVAADWDVWSVSIGAPQGSATPIIGDVSDRGTPSRLLVVSPDGEHLAYVTTSNGQRCDASFVVVVATVDDPATPVATHTLPVDVEPQQLIWTDKLDVVLPGGPPGVRLVPVRLDPLVGGPISLDNPVSLPSTYVLAPAHNDRFVSAFATDGENVTVSPGDVYSDVLTAPEWSFQIPLTDYSGVPTGLAMDGARSVWVVVAATQPDDPAVVLGYDTYRWAPDSSGRAAEQVSDEFVAVAASPFFPGEESAPPDTTPATEPTTTTTVATPAGDAFVYVTKTGEIYRQEIGFAPELVATLPSNPSVPADGSGADVMTGFLAVAPDGQTLYLARQSDATRSCLTALSSVALDDGTVTEIGPGSDPSVSPDGTKLAYLEHGSPDDYDVCPTDLVVRDLATGAERRWRDSVSYAGTGENLAVLNNLRWAPDNRTIAVERSYEDDQLFLFDTDSPEGDLTLASASLTGLSGGPDHSLVGVTEAHGVMAVEVIGWCYDGGECAGSDLVLTVPLDGSARPPDVQVTDLSAAADVGPGGVLFLACPPSGTICYDELRLQPASQSEQVVVRAGIQGFAWLP